MEHKEYERVGTFSIDEVFEFLGDDKENSFWKKRYKNFHGYEVHSNSQRYELFYKKGCTCVVCGLKGKYFALERHLTNVNMSSRYHFNLYGTNDLGEEVLITKDHIVPKSLGGKNSIDNYQTMCAPCNWKKKNNM